MICRISSRPQLCESWTALPQRTVVHEIKFDGYRIQMRVVDGEVTLKTRKGLDWTAKFQPSPKRPRKLPDASSTARYAPSTKRRA